MTLLTYQFIERQKTIVIIDDGNPNYVATAQFCIFGDKAIVHSISGEKFYRCVSEKVDEIFEDLNVTKIEAYVFAAHFRLIRMSLRRSATVEITDRGMMAGHEMIWITIRPKSKPLYGDVSND